MLTIVKRAGSLGLLAHGDAEDVYTRSSRELEGLIRIAFGGQVAEDLLARLRAETRRLLSDHRHLVEALRDALLARHELIGHEITDVLEQARAARTADAVIDLDEPRREMIEPDA